MGFLKSSSGGVEELVRPLIYVSSGGALNSISDHSSDGPNVRKIADFVSRSTGLKSWFLGTKIQITQKTDGKTLSFTDGDVDEVIPRLDSDGHPFLQVNFCTGKKILLTNNFIGFKPAQCAGLDMERLPKVVTTPDLISVVEAIEDSMSTGTTNDEVDILRRVFDAVLRGAESVGFDLTSERLWLQRISKSKFKASA
jgi:hypothetical protein